MATKTIKRKVEKLLTVKDYIAAHPEMKLNRNKVYALIKDNKVSAFKSPKGAWLIYEQTEVTETVGVDDHDPVEATDSSKTTTDAEDLKEAVDAEETATDIKEPVKETASVTVCPRKSKKRMCSKKAPKTYSTKEFLESYNKRHPKTPLTIAELRVMLMNGKVFGEKISGKWVIYQSPIKRAN